MICKTDSVREGFHVLDWRVKCILLMIDNRRYAMGMPELVITSTLREKGIHGERRAADIGVNSLTQVQIEMERDFINHTFPRPLDGYDTAILHDPISNKAKDLVFQCTIEGSRRLEAYLSDTTINHGHLHIHLQVASLFDSIYKTFGHEVMLRRT